MPKPVAEAGLAEIEEIVSRHPGGVSASEIAGALTGDVPRRTLQYRIKPSEFEAWQAAWAES